jgi:hypothetical protein
MSQSMKKIISLSALFATLLLSNDAFSQGSEQKASAEASTKVQIIKAISITKQTDIDFGNMAIGATNAVVRMNTNGTRTVVSGEVTLPSSSGTVTAGKFEVNGEAGYSYVISLTPTTITLQSGANTITLDNFFSLPLNNSTIPSGGKEDLFVGGNLNINANQPAGSYVSTANLKVTVQYN